MTPCHVGAAQRPGVRHPPGQEFARYASHWHARNVAGPSKDAVAVEVGEGFDPDAVGEGGGADAVAFLIGFDYHHKPKHGYWLLLFFLGGYRGVTP